jgi:hypothetical protein
MGRMPHLRRAVLALASRFTDVALSLFGALAVLDHRLAGRSHVRLSILLHGDSPWRFGIHHMLTET